YTGLFSVMLILFGMLADSLRRGKISVRRMTALLALELLLAGGMYPTALLTAVVLFLVMVDGLAGKKYGRNLKIQLTVLFLLYLPEFGLSIIAPGNARRRPCSSIGLPLRLSTSLIRNLWNICSRKQP